MRLRRALPRGVALAAAALFVTGAVAGLAAYRSIDDNIRTDEAAVRSLAELGAERPDAGDGRNILILGSDNPAYVPGALDEEQPAPDSMRSDTTMLLHISADGKRAAVVNVPRDLLVPLPRCRQRDGSYSTAQRAQFNWAFQDGGTACTVRTLEKLSGVRIDHHIVVDFRGFKRVVNALGGVEVDLEGPERDPNVGLDLPGGRQLLRGDDALAYVRAREYVGDGSDENRIDRQQEFLRLLTAQVRGEGTLTNAARLYPVLDAASAALTTDPGLDSVGALYDLVRTLQDIPAGRLSYLTVPARPAPADPDRLVLRRPEAGRLFAAVRTDRAEGWSGG